MSLSGATNLKGDLNTKIAECAVAIALNPRDARAYRQRGLLLARSLRYDEAMRDLDEALAINPSDAHVHGLRGLIWEKCGNVNRAVAELERAIALAPETSNIYEGHRTRILSEPRPEDGPSASIVRRQPIAGGSFNLLENPFIILGLSEGATAQEVKSAYEDAIEDGIASPEVLLRAQQTLLSPKLRIDAPLRHARLS